MTTNRTIFVYTTLYTATGGGQFAMTVLAQQLHARGYKSVFFTRPPFQVNHRYAQTLSEMGVPIHVFPRYGETWWGNSLVAVLASLLLLPYMLLRQCTPRQAWSSVRSILRTRLVRWEERNAERTLSQCLRAERDRGREVLLHLWIPAGLAPLLLRWANRQNVPAVFHDMGEADEAYLRKWDIAPAAAEMHRAAAVVCSCETVANNIRRVYGYRGEITSIPFPIADPGEAFERGQKKEGRFTIGIVGRLVEHKRHTDLLVVVNALTDRGYDVGLVIAGDGPMREPLEKEAARLGIADRVQFTGEFERLDEVMALFDVFAITSSSESQCMPIVESGAYAKPVVVADYGGMPDFVENGVTGFLVPLGDIDSLVASLQKLIDDPAICRAMGQAGRRRYLEQHTPERITDAHERVYDRLLADRPAAGLNLAYVVEYYATFMVDEIYWLRKLGARVTLLSAFRPVPDPDPKKDAYRQESLYFPSRYRGVFWANIRCFATRPLAYFRTLRLLRREGESFRMLLLAAFFARQVRLEGIHHLHGTFGTRTTTLAAAIARLSGRDYSFTTHAYDIYRPNPSLVWKTNESRFMRTISEFNRRYILETYRGVVPEKISVVYLGVETAKFVPRHAPRPVEGIASLVSVGNLHEKKGHAYLVRACGILARRGYSFSCSIVGEGDNRALLREIEAHGVGAHVKLLGGLTHEAVGRLLKESDVFVLACVDARDKGEDLDGIPVSLMEAMAVGMPVVSTRLTGIPELIEDGVSGLLVPEKDEQSLASALVRVIEDRDLRTNLGHASRERIVDKFDLRTNVKEFATLLRQAG